MESIKSKINGVNVDQLIATIDVIKSNPDMASCHFRAVNRWQDGGHCQTTIKDFDVGGRTDDSRDKPFVLDADEPPVLMGENRGANPVEHVLTALSSCVTTTLIYNAAAQGVKIDAVESQLEGDLDLRGLLGLSENVRNGYQNIRITFKIKSDAPREKLQELVALAQKRSPVFDIVTNQTPVQVALAQIEEPPIIERMAA